MNSKTGRVEVGLNCENLEAVVAQAELPPLLAAAYVLTGDESLIESELQPQLKPLIATVEPQGGMPAAAQNAAIRKLLPHIAKVGQMSEPTPAESRDRILRAVDFMTGGKSEDYKSLIVHELGVETANRSEIPNSDFKVAIIGAGMSGLAIAYELEQQGISYVLLEKNQDVGGAWLENIYPGCRLDTNNFAYSFSWAHRPSWPDQFSRQKDILSYFNDVARDHGLRERIHFGVEVKTLDYDSSSSKWTVGYAAVGGDERQLIVANAVVLAVGQLNQPQYPEIAGNECFQGSSFHSAKWDTTANIDGARVAVIGTGASAFQIVPSIAERVAELNVFQRTPPWMVATPTYHMQTPPGLEWLLHNVPGYSRWLRLWQFWIATEGRFEAVIVDEAWQHPVSVSAQNEVLRTSLLDHLERHFGDDPALLKQVTPTYAPGAKRLLRDDGTWARTLKRDNVTLVTTPIDRIVGDGIITSDGSFRAADTIVFATGFRAADFFDPIVITGPGGVQLQRDIWKGDARAYLGAVLPGMPNLFSIYGPNTNLVAHGSIVFMSECAANYTVACIRALAFGDFRSMTVKSTVFDAYNLELDKANRKTAWGAASVSSWYRNRYGRSAQNWPYPLLDYWQKTREVRLDEFDLK